jgi:peptidoglycan/LPS O-acetylase OafA/YrhL
MDPEDRFGVSPPRRLRGNRRDAGSGDRAVRLRSAGGTCPNAPHWVLQSGKPFSPFVSKTLPAAADTDWAMLDPSVAQRRRSADVPSSLVVGPGKGTAAKPRHVVGVGRVGSLDGIRALAVLAVIAYHSGVPWLKGGFYGVDAFLVLSGYLITSLLIAEHTRSGNISLVRFWGRRARRLLPGLFLMLLGVSAVAAAWPAVLGAPHLLADTLASLLYVSNWHLSAEHASYFAIGANPSPLLHTWTLGVEEQFYLLWPLLVVAVLGWRGRAEGSKRSKRLAVLLVMSVAATGASAIWMAILTPGGIDPSRAYYGSDTRAQGLLVGAALAIVTVLWGPVRSRAGRLALSAAGVLGAASMGLMWWRVPESSPLAFHGGFLLVALSAAAVIASAVGSPAGQVGRVLSVRPLRYLGRLSYGMYLWYWPVLLVMDAGRTHLHTYVLLAARLGVVIALAAASYHLVEMPIRADRASRWRARLAIPMAACVASFAVLAAAVATPVASAASVGSAPLSSASGPGAAASIPAASAASAAPGGPAAALTFGALDGAQPKVRILLLGDSVAGTLGVGLGALATQYGAEVINRGEPGCSLSMDQLVKVLWYTLPPGVPCLQGDPSALIAQMRAWVDQYQPDVVVYLARGETLDQEHTSSWQHLGQPAFDAWVTSRFDTVIPALSATGAKVVLLSSPFYSTGEDANGALWPEDDPQRVLADRRIMAAAVQSSPGVASVIDLGSWLSPGGRFASQVGGVQARCADGVHITTPGGEWLGARLLPQLVALGRSHLGSPVVAARAPLPPEPSPAWVAKLPCGS